MPPDATPRRPSTVAFLIKSDKLHHMSHQAGSSGETIVKPKAGSRATTRSRTATAPTPVGTTAGAASARRAAASSEYRVQQAEREGLREIAWLLIKYRMDRGLSQENLAELVGTSHSQISRIESGRHRTNLETLSRIAHALGLRMVIGFESMTSSGRAKRDLVAF